MTLHNAPPHNTHTTPHTHLPPSLQVIEVTRANFPRLTITQFFPLYRSFHIWPNKVSSHSDSWILGSLSSLFICSLAQFLEEYLRQYRVPAGVRISDGTWKELFGEVVKR